MKTSRRTARSAWLAKIVLAGFVVACGGADSSGPNDDDEVPTVALVSSFGSNPGNLRMYHQVSGLRSTPHPLVIVLHGCTEDAQAQVATGWAALAIAWKFDVAFAEQQSANNALRCFNWFDPADAARGAGEALSIKQMVDHAATLNTVDQNHVYIVGLSGGAAMAAVMVAVYPDVFAGGAFIAGVPFRCAANLVESLACLAGNVANTPVEWGDRVRAQASVGSIVRRISIWHGADDNVVASPNSRELMEQWTNVLGLSQTPSSTTTVGAAQRHEFRDGAGTKSVERYEIPGFGHGTPINPAEPNVGGCGTQGPYRIINAICAPARIAEFFGLSPALQ